jgi:hypothetical protein
VSASPVDTMRGALFGLAGDLQLAVHELGVAHVKEADMRRACVRALQAEVGRGVQPERSLKIERWARIGGVDVAITASDGSATLLAELKWCLSDKLYETLWDALKMSLATATMDVGLACVVAAAPEQSWAASPLQNLFTSASWDTSQIFAHFAEEWEWLLKGSSSRPTALPARIETSLIGSLPIHVDGGDWSLRALGVRGVAPPWLGFAGDWPAQGKA